MIEDKKFIQEVLGKIKKENIKPTPKWHFLLKNYIVWFLGVLSLLVGGVSFSVIIYLMRYNDWDIYEQLGESFISFTLLTMPYFWIISLVLFVCILLYNIKHTKKGYRYSLPFILSVNILFSMVLGILFYEIGISQSLDDVLGERAPLYSKIINRQLDYWSQPENGRLSGLVVEVGSSTDFLLVDFNQKEWNIKNEEESEMDIVVGMPVRILGEKTSENDYLVEMIIPAGKPGGGLFKLHRKIRFLDFESGENFQGDIINDPKFMAEKKRLDEILEKYPELQAEKDRRMREEFNIGGPCGVNEDCMLPFDFAINSSCPFEAKCVSDECRIVCMDFYNLENDGRGGEVSCERNEDCSCESNSLENQNECLCLEARCGLLVE